MKQSVIVVGAGIVGAAVARELSLAGHQVTVLEKGSAGGAVSGASLACIGSHMIDFDELPLLSWSCRAWAEFAKKSSTNFEYRRCGQIRFIEREEDIAITKSIVEAERENGASSVFVDRETVHRIEPNLTGPILAASHDPDAAMVNPFQAVRALLLEAKENGARIRTHKPVEMIETRNGRVCGVVSDGETIRADNIVLACGPWTATLAQSCGLNLAILPRKAQCLATVAMPANTIRNVISSCEASGGVDAGYTQIQQTFSGQILFNTVLAGGLSKQGAQNNIPEVDADFVADSIETLLRLFPILQSTQLLRSWVRFEAVTPDDRFFIGPLEPKGLFVAAGDSGTGFTRAPAIGRLIKEVLSDEVTSFRTDIYAPDRFSEVTQ